MTEEHQSELSNKPLHMEQDYTSIGKKTKISPYNNSYLQSERIWNNSKFRSFFAFAQLLHPYFFDDSHFTRFCFLLEPAGSS